MSRSYEVGVYVKGITKEQLNAVLVERFGWEEIDLSDGEFHGNGCLYGGQSEEEAHEEISKAIKELNLKAKVRTSWTYLEDLPYEEYGDEMD